VQLRENNRLTHRFQGFERYERHLTRGADERIRAVLLRSRMRPQSSESRKRLQARAAEVFGGHCFGLVGGLDEGVLNGGYTGTSFIRLQEPSSSFCPLEIST
jgi:hypothetical protein